MQDGGESFKVKDVVSVVIHNSEKRVVGVVQMINKPDEGSFTNADVQVLEVRTLPA